MENMISAKSRVARHSIQKGLEHTLSFLNHRQVVLHAGLKSSVIH